MDTVLLNSLPFGRAHSDLVWAYRAERERQETAHEITLTAKGEKHHWKANGGKLINFKDWLKANKRIERIENGHSGDSQGSNGFGT